MLHLALIRVNIITQDYLNLSLLFVIHRKGEHYFRATFVVMTENKICGKISVVFKPLFKRRSIFLWEIKIPASTKKIIALNFP